MGFPIDPVNSSHFDGNQVPTVMGVIGTLGTADTKGTALPLPIAVDPSSGAMYVNNLSGAGTTNIQGSVSVTSGTINLSTVNSSTINTATINSSTVNVSTINAGTINVSTINAGTINVGTFSPSYTIAKGTATDISPYKFNCTGYNSLMFLTAGTFVGTISLTGIAGTIQQIYILKVPFISIAGTTNTFGTASGVGAYVNSMGTFNFLGYVSCAGFGTIQFGFDSWTSGSAIVAINAFQGQNNRTFTNLVDSSGTLIPTDPTYGLAVDVKEIVAGTLNAATINTGTINSATINFGTINTSTVNSSTLNAGTINTGTINLATVTMTIGTLTAGTVNASTVNAGTINTGTINLGSVGGLGANAAATVGFPQTIAGMDSGGTTYTLLADTTRRLHTVQQIGTVNAGTINAATINSSTLNFGTINAATINTGTINAATINSGTINAGTIGAATINAGTIRWDGRSGRNLLSFGTRFGNAGSANATMIGSAAVGVGTSIWVQDISIVNNATTNVDAGISFGTILSGSANLVRGVFGGNGGIEKSFSMPVNAGMTNFDLTCYASAGTCDFTVSYFISA